MSKEKRIKKVYIAGKIGEDILSDTTRKKFAEAEAWLKAKDIKCLIRLKAGLASWQRTTQRHVARTSMKRYFFLTLCN